MKFKEKRLKSGEKNEDFYHVFKAFEVLSTFSNVCQINIAAKDGIPSCRVSRNPTIFNIIHWVAGLIISMTKRRMVQGLF